MYAAHVLSVLDNLDSTFRLLSGHVYMHDITDVGITAPAGRTTETAWGTLTHIRLQALQLTVKEVLFFYRDKTVTIWVMEFNLPTQGLDVDFQFERVDARLSDNITLQAIQPSHLRVRVNLFLSCAFARRSKGPRGTDQSVVRLGRRSCI